MPIKRYPKVGMKVVFPFQVSACCWVDLLGYGAAIKEANYNPLNPTAKSAVRRIRAFHQVVADHSARSFPTLVMNDGATSYRDLSYRARSPTYDFIRRAFNFYEDVQAIELGAGHPGARMVIAAGFRLRGRASQSNNHRGRFVKQILNQLEKQKITQEQAVTRASQYRRTFDVLPQLQANFAFTKAYIAEQSGTKGGLPGPAIYIDSLFFDEKLISNSDIELGCKIAWASPDYGLSANFFELKNVGAAKQIEVVERRAVHNGSAGVHDALKIAQLLSGDKDVLKALRLARRTRNSS